MSHNSYVVLVIDPERNQTHMRAEWEVADSDAELYVHAARVAAQLVNTIGLGSAIVHIELTSA